MGNHLMSALNALLLDRICLLRQDPATLVSCFLSGGISFFFQSKWLVVTNPFVKA